MNELEREKAFYRVVNYPRCGCPSNFIEKSRRHEEVNGTTYMLYWYQCQTCGRQGGFRLAPGPENM